MKDAEDRAPARPPRRETGASPGPLGGAGPAAPEDSTINISLRVNLATGEALVDQLDWRLPEALSRVRFNAPLPMDRALPAEFVTALRPHLPDWGAQTIHADRGFVYEIPGLVIGGLRVIAAAPRDGAQHVMLRFRHALGDQQLLLNPGHRPRESVRHVLEKEAAQVLSDLMRPCLDLAAVDPIDGARAAPGALEWRLRRLAENKEEMEFFAWLLSRYVAQGELRGHERQEPELPVEAARKRLAGPAA